MGDRERSRAPAARRTASFHPSSKRPEAARTAVPITPLDTRMTVA